MSLKRHVGSDMYTQLLTWLYVSDPRNFWNIFKMKDGSLLIYLASFNCFTSTFYRQLFFKMAPTICQKWLNDFLSKSSTFCVLRIIRFYLLWLKYLSNNCKQCFILPMLATATETWKRLNVEFSKKN